MNDFQNLRQISKNLGQVTSQLPKMVEVLKKQIKLSADEVEKTYTGLGVEIDQIGLKIQKRSIDRRFMDSVVSLDQIQKEKITLSQTFAHRLKEISKLVNDAYKETQKQVFTVTRLIEEGQFDTAPNVDINLADIKEHRQASLNLIKNLANSTESTVLMMKEIALAEGLTFSKSTAVKTDQIVRSAIFAYSIDDIDTSIQYLERAIRLSPEQPALYCNLGMLYLETDRMDDAMSCLEKANKINPNLTSNYFLSAKIATKKGQTAKALSNIKNALEQTDNILIKKKLLLEIAFLHYQRGEIQDAELHWQKVLEINPLEDEPRRWLSIINPP
jgi:predicted Zn-dependent protease